VTPDPPDDEEFQQKLDQIERQALEAIRKERVAEALLTPRERIKKRLNLPNQLPADYRSDSAAPVLSLAHAADDPSWLVVVNNVGISLKMPRVLFEYLYRPRPLTADDRRVIHDFLVQYRLDPESL